MALAALPDEPDVSRIGRRPDRRSYISSRKPTR
jgi:hypothetical protein